MRRVVFNQRGGVGTSTTTRRLPVLQPYLSASVKIKESHEQVRPMIHLDTRHKVTHELVALLEALA